MKNKIKNLIDNIKRAIFTEIFVCDSLFLIALTIINLTNFAINKYFGLYFLSANLIAASIFINKTKKK